MIGSLNNGGSQALVMNLYRNINRSEIQFDFVIDRQDELFFADEIKAYGGKVFFLPITNITNIFDYTKAWNSFFKKHPEYNIIHGHVRSTASIYLNIAKRNRLITIAHSHSTSSGKGVQAVVKNILQYPLRYTVDYMIACSLFAGTWLFGKNVVDKENFFVFNNAIDTKKFQYNESTRIKKRKEYNIEGKFVLGHVGRFHQLKNHDFLIDIFAEFYKSNKNSALILIGDGQEFMPIKEKVNRLGMTDNVIFAGIQSNIAEYMQAMDVFIFPSKFEGLGIVTIEAQAMGLSCIVSEAIPSEAFVTNLITSLPLNRPAKDWANKINRFGKKYKRENMSSTIKQAGYDIEDSTLEISEFYTMIARKKNEVGICD